MTRAGRHLILTRARRRLWHGRIREAKASPFLADIPQILKELRRHEALKKEAPAYRQLTLFDDA
jgi:superfamily I DNA/RNA helicase